MSQPPVVARRRPGAAWRQRCVRALAALALSATVASTGSVATAASAQPEGPAPADRAAVPRAQAGTGPAAGDGLAASLTLERPAAMQAGATLATAPRRGLVADDDDPPAQRPPDPGLPRLAATTDAEPSAPSRAWEDAVADPSLPGGLLIRRVRWILSDSATAPPDDAPGWRTAELPLRWQHPDEGRLSAAWFRASFELDDPARMLLGLYLPKFGNGGTVWLNGHVVGAVRTVDERVQVRWFRPFLFTVHSDLLRPGRNELLVRQQTRDPRNVFRSLEIGPLDLLAERHDALLFWQHTMATPAAWFCLLVGLFMIGVWWRRSDEVLFAVFGVSCLMWSIRSLSFIVEVIPLQHWFAWRALHHVATGGFIALMAIGLAWFAGRHPRILVPVAIGYWAAGVAVFLLIGWPARDWLDRFWVLGFLPLMVYSVGALAGTWWREREGSQLALLIAILCAIAMALHDYAIGRDPSLLPASTFFGMHVAAPVVLASLGAHLLDRFVRSLQGFETLTRSLEQRVAAREHELAVNFMRLRSLERERALADERQRIMREMHDGVGSQLLSSLAMVERGAADRDDIARMLRECLDDMRLAIDTLTPVAADLGGALGNLRYRLAPRFDALGIRNRWDLQSLPDHLPVNPHDSLQLLRIVQESLANVLKHARARAVSVRASVEAGQLVLEVSDDGVGFDTGVEGPGRGLRNMRRRAADAGATLVIDGSSAGGTRVRIARTLAASGAVTAVAARAVVTDPAADVAQPAIGPVPTAATTQHTSALRAHPSVHQGAVPYAPR
jgi:signal transduction histidine kinase